MTTGRPDDIPQDVWFKAHNAIGYDSGCDCDHCCQTQQLAEPVARAILAAKAEEREACAQAANQMLFQPISDGAKIVSDRDAAFYMADKIMTAIRKRGEG